MSQRTRNRTTGAASRKARATSAPGAHTPAPATPATAPTTSGAGATPPAEATPTTGQHPLDAALIARTLRAVADELERDPALARRVASSAGHRVVPDDDDAAALTLEHAAPPHGAPPSAGGVFRPRLVTGTATDLAPGIPDPYALRAEHGEAGLRAVLATLRLGTLRAIIRAHALDPSGRLSRQNDAERLRVLILAASSTAQP